MNKENYRQDLDSMNEFLVEMYFKIIESCRNKDLELLKEQVGEVFYQGVIRAVNLQDRMRKENEQQ